MTTKCQPLVRHSIVKGRIELDTPFSFYGEYKNIRLMDEEYQKLKDKLQGHTDTMIEKLSRYLKSKGTDYKDHYVTILNRYEQDKDKLTQENKSNIPTWEDRTFIAITQGGVKAFLER